MEPLWWIVLTYQWLPCGAGAPQVERRAYGYIVSASGLEEAVNKALESFRKEHGRLKDAFEKVYFSEARVFKEDDEHGLLAVGPEEGD